MTAPAIGVERLVPKAAASTSAIQIVYRENTLAKAAIRWLRAASRR